MSHTPTMLLTDVRKWSIHKNSSYAIFMVVMSGRITISADKHNKGRGIIYLALKLSQLRGGSVWKVKFWNGCPVQQPSLAPLFKLSWAIWFVNPLSPCGPRLNTLPLCCQFRTLAKETLCLRTLSLHSDHSLFISNFESHP